MDRIVIVGASTAGLTAAETLRKAGFDGTLTLLGAERHLPYGRPPLSKQVLMGTWTPNQTMLTDEEALDRLGTDLRLETAAIGLDLDRRTVALSGGDAVPYDGLVVATGVSPRRLPHGQGLTGVHVLRTLDDAVALRTEFLRSRPNVVVVGAGFVGTEVAAAARQMGLDVTVVDPLSLPMVSQLGATVARSIAQLHVDRGVRFVLGSAVTRLVGSEGRVVGVQLTGGRWLPAELVLVAIGSDPNTTWLKSSGLSTSNGLDCDERCRAAPGVVAAGDVASWPHPILRRRVRVEHRLNAAEQARAAALSLLGVGRSAYAPMPYFWSDQYDVRIQSYGFLSDDAAVEIVAGQPSSGAFAAVYRRGRRVVGALSWNMPQQAKHLRQMISNGLEIESPDGKHQVAGVR